MEEDQAWSPSMLSQAMGQDRTLRDAATCTIRKRTLTAKTAGSRLELQTAPSHSLRCTISRTGQVQPRLALLDTPQIRSLRLTTQELDKVEHNGRDQRLPL